LGLCCAHVVLEGSSSSCKGGGLLLELSQLLQALLSQDL
jgi:hypothetical protein